MRHIGRSDSRRSNTPQLTPEILGAIRRTRLLVEMFREDDELRKWARQKYLQERKSDNALAQDFIASPFGKAEAYVEATAHIEVLKKALWHLKYEILDPAEIIELKKDVQGQVGKSIVEIRGDIAWFREENQRKLRLILAEEGAQREIPIWTRIAERFTQMTGLPVTWETCRGRMKNKRSRKTTTPRKSPNKLSGAAKERGQIIWDDRLDGILQTIIDEPESKRMSVNSAYIVGRIAEEFGKVVTKSNLSYILKQYNLLSDVSEVEE